jgi:uridine phosphorylase
VLEHGLGEKKVFGMNQILYLSRGETDGLQNGMILNILKNNQVEHSAGIILTSDLFYPSLLPTDLEFYKKAGALAVEMECSTLFIISSLRKIKASAILAIDGHPLKWNEGQYDPESLILKKSLEKAAKYALETLVSFKE